MNCDVKDHFYDLMNRYGANCEPFLFIIDFEMNHPEIYKINAVPPGIRYSTPLISNENSPREPPCNVSLGIEPVNFSTYLAAFKTVQENILRGNSYLVNLTFPTTISTRMTLQDIFYSSRAKYKLLYHDKFVVFSPEIFMRIEKGTISAFPMKGTIDASIPDAENVLLSDEKEEAEHATIVDLLRNDLGKVADNVIVKKYRYVDRIKTTSIELLQVSSEINGSLSDRYVNRYGDIVKAMLPAGSVTGAPKNATLRIIKESEKFKRDWYTGIFGVFDGRSLDSCVMIRFIEKSGDNLFFRSGGGITSMSDPVKEYNELISKIYVPVG
jgi:para-aminobenzoate synthetase component I